ncbi:uncharacterized protein FIBRA_06451 [Fibroporia radiculosa]|uniref:Uncharacterized protein n=1 Tax=Fibroporia radiculosa TaxID=599839 RepID=J4GSR8_9APHY|nr:uncharacterized protein FIBRA_06451 [Fibroporia radiculosa]CCM04280.1 predicted protein [Fibroporia radiculosa]
MSFLTKLEPKYALPHQSHRPVHLVSDDELGDFSDVNIFDDIVLVVDIDDDLELFYFQLLHYLADLHVDVDVDVDLFLDFHTTSQTTSPTTSTTNTATTTTSSPTTTSYSSSSLTTYTSQSTSDGQIVTYTSTVAVYPTTSANSDASTGSSFWNNKGDVAGVFTVVGVVALVVLIAIITGAVRRRRARKFDRDAAEAAAEAAANTHAPDFTDDDYGYRDDRNQDFAERGGYSDTASHGTFSQPPMQPGESYNMSELPPFDPYFSAGAAGDPYSAAGAAGIGAGVNRARSLGHTNTFNPYTAPTPVSVPNAYQDGSPPLGAYGAPQNQYGAAMASSGVNSNSDLLAAAGIAGGAGGAAAGLARGPSPIASSGPQDTLARNRSLGANTLMSSGSEYSTSAATHQQYGAYPSATQGQPGARPVSFGDPTSNSTESLPNPFGSAAQPGETSLLGATFSSPENSADEHGAELGGGAPHSPEENRMSLRDEDDYGFNGGRRVLKVANE